MLWGLTLYPGNVVKETVDYDVHLSMAALETRQEYASNADGQAQLIVQTERGQFVVCTLMYGSILQQTLDMEIRAGEMVTLFSHGKGVIHLTGNAANMPPDTLDCSSSMKKKVTIKQSPGPGKSATESRDTDVHKLESVTSKGPGQVTIKEEPPDSDEQPCEEDMSVDVETEESSQNTRGSPAKKSKGKERKKTTDRCVVCGKWIVSSAIKMHVAAHFDDRPHKCPTCGKGFKQPGNLQTHLRIHSGEKPFSCQTCQKSFTDLGTCRRHEKIHSGETPFHCDYCSKGFPEKAALVRHVRIHSGEKPFTCGSCPKTFSDRGQLKRHERSHLKGAERAKYNGQCDECGKVLKDASSLKRHKLLHTDIKPYVCQICSKPFNDPSTLRQHYRMHDRLAKERGSMKCLDCPAQFETVDEWNDHTAYHCEGVDRNSTVTLQIENVALNSVMEEEDSS